MNTDDELEILQAKREHINEWIRRYKLATDALPFVKMQKEIVEWEEQALNNRPNEADEITLSGLNMMLQREFDYLDKALPLPPIYDPEDLLNSIAFSASGTATVYEYVARVGDLGTPIAIEYSTRLTEQYHELQTIQNRIQAVRNLVAKLNNPQTKDRFERAFHSYSATKTEVGNRTATALEIRTFLDGVQGDLFSLAKKWPKENMTWKKMAERLAKNSSNSTARIEIIEQEKKRSSLISRLSEIAKDRESGSLTNIEATWTQTLDHVYTVLGLINFPKA